MEDVQLVNTYRQSELYIKGFKAQFDSLPESKKKVVIKEIKSYITRLDTELTKSQNYRKLKLERITNLQKEMAISNYNRYTRYDTLYKEYMHLSFDSAYTVAKKALALAKQIGSKDLITDAHIKLGDMFISGGYFREADHVINDYNPEGCSNEMYKKWMLARFRLEYENGFFFAWRLYQPDMALSNMTELYNELLPLCPDDSYELYRLKTSMAFYRHQYKEGAGFASILLTKTPKNSSEYIIALGDLGFNQMGENKFTESMKNMVESAIMAIQQGSNNYSAIRKIAEMMFVVGDIKTASRYIKVAMNNATEYNSKYRIIESSKGYPIINHLLQKEIEHDKQMITIVVIVLASVVLSMIVSLIYILRQRKQIFQQVELISEYNVKLEAKNKEIESYNQIFRDNYAIASVLVAKMITNNAQSNILINKLQKDLLTKIKVRQYDTIPGAVDVCKKEFNVLCPNIDEVLLAFFPNFASQFNALLPEDSKLDITTPKKLPVEMRIFALWRIGVRKNENIANCMGYSVNTIKSYKTKIINATGLEKDDFYSQLMKISVDM
ncbi:MAG: hypothetical protein EP145_06755 [Bacteroides uniformis]|nr:hypothetical protein [Bacteroides uniformis]